MVGPQAFADGYRESTVRERDCVLAQSCTLTVRSDACSLTSHDARFRSSDTLLLSSRLRLPAVSVGAGAYDAWEIGHARSALHAHYRDALTAIPCATTHTAPKPGPAHFRFAPPAHFRWTGLYCNN
jgi:hypothetical protein